MGKFTTMAEHRSTVLARSDWLNALRELAVNCSEDEASETADRLRELNALLVMAPEAALMDGLRALGPSRLETLIAAGAYETAVMTMLSHGAGFLVSRSAEGQSLATVALPGTLRERSGAGSTPALALIGALSLSLSNAAAASRLTSLPGGPHQAVALH